MIRKENYLDLVLSIKDGVCFTENDDGTVVVEMENTGFFNRIAQRFFKKPKVSHITLDDIGSAAFLSIDGEKSVYEIVRHLEKSFPGENNMAQRASAFLGQMERLGWIEHL